MKKINLHVDVFSYDEREIRESIFLHKRDERWRRKFLGFWLGMSSCVLLIIGLVLVQKYFAMQGAYELPPSISLGVVGIGIVIGGISLYNLTHHETLSFTLVCHGKRVFPYRVQAEGSASPSRMLNRLIVTFCKKKVVSYDVCVNSSPPYHHEHDIMIDGETRLCGSLFVPIAQQDKKEEDEEKKKMSFIHIDPKNNQPQLKIPHREKGKALYIITSIHEDPDQAFVSLQKLDHVLEHLETL